MKLKRIVKKDGSITYINADTNEEVFIKGYTKIVNKKVYHCETCGLEVLPEYNFCKNCGSKVIKERLCSKCNISLKVDGDYCPNCGSKFQNAL